MYNICNPHKEECLGLSTPPLGVRNYKNSTWLVCVVQREYSTYTSLCIFNDYPPDPSLPSSIHPDRIHCEAKFFEYWKKSPRKIFPDLPLDGLDKKGIDLVWYMLRPPCGDCTEIIIDRRAMYNKLTIKIPHMADKDGINHPIERIRKLIQNKIEIKAMPVAQYEYYTSGRQGHNLPQLRDRYSTGIMKALQEQLYTIVQENNQKLKKFPQIRKTLRRKNSLRIKTYSKNKTMSIKGKFDKSKEPD